MPLGGLDLPSLPPQPPMPSSLLPHSILKKQAVLPQQPPVPGEEVPSYIIPPQHKIPPGCPPTLPVELSDDEGGDYDLALQKSKKIRFEDEENAERSGDEEEEGMADDGDKSKAGSGLTSLQAKLLLLSGQDVDQFVRETEVLLQEKEHDKNADLQKRLSRLKDSTISYDDPAAPGEDMGGAKPSDVVGAPPLFNVGPPVPVPPPQIPSLFRPPPPRAGLLPPVNVRLPPGPPPQNLGSLMPPPQGGQMPPRLPNMRLPPPVRAMAPPPPTASTIPSNVLSAGPQLVTRPPSRPSQQTATIQAKPQIRSLSADVTRFLPTSLRVKREDKKKGSKADGKEGVTRMEEMENKKPTKDDAYSQFMREMEDLM